MRNIRMHKLVIMRMVAPNTSCAYYENEIQEAIRFASHNLELRHRICIEWANALPSGDILLCLDVPDKQVENFQPGPRLKGVGTYLLRHYPDMFKSKRMGTRLFSCSLVDDASFAEDVLGIELYPYQKELLKKHVESNQKKFCNKMKGRTAIK